MPLPTWTAGRRVRASELTAVNTQITTDGTNIDALGEVTTPVHGGSAAAYTTTEIAASTLTATLVSGRKYYVMVSFSFGSTIANDVSIFRVRYRAGASIGTVNTATQAHIQTMKSVAANTGYPVAFFATLPSLSGQYTIALTAIRSSGSGNLQIDGTSDGTDRTFALLDMGT
jgi:hypothetical protein